MKILIQYIKYSLSTLLGTITDTGVLWLVSTYLLGSSHVDQYIVAPCISFECAVIVNYTVAYFYVWRERIDRFSVGSFLGHFWKYNLSCISAFIVKMFILNAIAVAFKFDTVICNLLALCVSGVMNFALNEFLVFRRPSKKRAEEDN